MSGVRQEHEGSGLLTQIERTSEDQRIAKYHRNYTNSNLFAKLLTKLVTKANSERIPMPVSYRAELKGRLKAANEEERSGDVVKYRGMLEDLDLPPHY